MTTTLTEPVTEPETLPGLYPVLHPQRLREAVEVIESNLRRWNQNCWATGRVPWRNVGWGSCNTVHCIAGWGALLAGWLPEYEPWSRNTTGEFYPPSDPTMIRSAFHIAQEHYGLTDQEAVVLFYGTPTDLTVLKDAVRRIINGHYRSAAHAA